MKTLFEVGDIVTAGPCMSKGSIYSIPHGETRFVQKCMAMKLERDCAICGRKITYVVRISMMPYKTDTYGHHPCALSLYNSPPAEVKTAERQKEVQT